MPERTKKEHLKSYNATYFVSYFVSTWVQVLRDFQPSLAGCGQEAFGRVLSVADIRSPPLSV